MTKFCDMKAIILATMVVFCAALAPLRADAEQLEIWHSEVNPATLKAVDDIARRFEEKNPGIDVKVSPIGWVDLQKKIVTAVEGGAPPDLMQLEPHHVAYLISKGLLQPLDSVVEHVGADRIFDAVRDLQLYNDHYYGIAHGLGISYIGIRKDLLPERQLLELENWQNLLALYQRIKKERPDIPPLLLPANDLHLTILFSELLASNNGSIFRGDGTVDFSTQEIRETLEYLNKLYALVPTQFKSTEYIENFSHYALGKTFSLPGFFGRGTLAIEQKSPPELRTAEHFSFVDQPRGPSAQVVGSQSFATIDAEPWVIPAEAKQPELAKEFLKFFYEEDNYLIYTQSVPIHLTPIFKDLATSPEYTKNPHVQRWLPYHKALLKRLEDGTVRPIFMSSLEDRMRPALYRLEGTRVVPEMIRAVYAGTSIEDATREATEKARRMTDGIELSVDKKSVAHVISEDSGTSGIKNGSDNRMVYVAIIALIILVIVVTSLRRKNR